MIAFIILSVSVVVGLLVSLIMPGGMQDINIGFYIIILALFATGALAIIVRKASESFHVISDYIVIILSIVIIAEIVLIAFSGSDSSNGLEQAIIVPGSGLFVESRMTSELESRLDKALEISKKHPDLPIVLSGGQVDKLTLPQCVAMKNYLETEAEKKDVALPEIISDGASHGIYNNVCTALDRAEVESAYIIVNHHNVPRTKLIASRVSPKSTIIGADLPASKYLIYYIRELGYGLKTLVADGTN